MRGALCWAELATTDTTAAKAFYGGLLGWTYEPVEMPPRTPAIVGVRNRTGGLNANFRDAPGQPPAWLPYFEVESAGASAERVSELGGKVLFGPMDIPSGRMAIAADPDGAVFGLLETRSDGLAA